MGIKLHTRHAARNKAKADIDIAIIDIIERYELTLEETCSIVSSSLHSWCNILVKENSKKEGS